MSPLQHGKQTTTHNIESTLLRALAHVGQKTVCDALDRDKGQVSYFFSNTKGMTLTFAELCKIIAALDLKCVDKDQETLDINEFNSYKFLAKKWLMHEQMGGEEL